MRKYTLNLADDKRILSATYEEYAVDGMSIVDALPEGNISDYLYIDGAFVYEPLSVPEPEPYVPSQDELQWQTITDLEIQILELKGGNN